MGYLDKALETMQQQGGRIVNHNLLDATLREIGAEYPPGLIRWIREQPDRWGRLLHLEATINRATLAQDEKGISMALSDYRKFFHDMISVYQEKGQTGNLF